MYFVSRDVLEMTLKRKFQGTKYFYVYDVIFDETASYYADIVVFKANSQFDAYIGKKEAEESRIKETHNYFFLTEEFLSKYQVVTLMRTTPNVINVDTPYVYEFEATVNYFKKIYGYIPKHNYYLSGHFTLNAKITMEGHKFIDWHYFTHIEDNVLKLCT